MQVLRFYKFLKTMILQEIPAEYTFKTLIK
jgi:hypothetical protein